MTRRVLIFYGFFWHLAFAQIPCVSVNGARILGEDLARAVPSFKSVPPDVPIAPSPSPGSTRVFSVAELQSLAIRFGIHDAVLTDTCFRLATEPLNRDLVLAAMRDALKIPDVRLEIL